MRMVNGLRNVILEKREPIALLVAETKRYYPIYYKSKNRQIKTQTPSIKLKFYRLIPVVKRGYGELPLKDWEVPVMISYNSRYKQLEYKKSIMEPLLLKSPSEPEKKFMEKLANSHKVRWWFKNGENDIEYFAILYQR